MLARIYSSTVIGMDIVPIEIEVDAGKGLSKLAIVGLPDEAVKEAKDRVKSSIINSGYKFPAGRLTINLAPATIKKVGPDFDLALALGILTASKQLAPRMQKKYIVLGELALDGRVRWVKGILPRIMDIKEKDIEGVILPLSNAREAGIIQGKPVYPVSTLQDAVRFLKGELDIKPYKVDIERIFAEESKYSIDFSDVKGQYAAKRALEIAAAGSHNIIMIGSPGIGKTMLAKRLATIVPDMSIDESIETTILYSVAGFIKKGQALVGRRPFRSPHYTISNIGLVGGGSYPRPGEISLAHNGVLFMDELPEFNRNVLDVLRQPMEDGSVNISRAKGSASFPARFMLVAAMNPCPCGYFGHPTRECRCTPGQRQRYMSRVSGPLLDRIDIQIEVPPVEYRKMKEDTGGMRSEIIKKEVVKTRDIQRERFRGRKIYSNSRMSSKDIHKYCRLDSDSEQLLELAMTELGLSARSHDKILKIARTIADIEREENINSAHISEAIQYRVLDRNLAF